MSLSPTYVDDFFVCTNPAETSTDIQNLKRTVNKYSSEQFLWVSLAEKLQNATGFFNAIYESGTFQLFDKFPTDNYGIRRIFIEYNYNPTIENFEAALNFIFGESWDYTELLGEVNLTISSGVFEYLLTGTDAINGTDYNITTDTGENIEIVFPPDVVVNLEGLGILYNFVPKGVKLNISIGGLLKDVKSGILGRPKIPNRGSFNKKGYLNG